MFVDRFLKVITHDVRLKVHIIFPFCKSPTETKTEDFYLEK